MDGTHAVPLRSQTYHAPWCRLGATMEPCEHASPLTAHLRTDGAAVVEGGRKVAERIVSVPRCARVAEAKEL